MESMGSASEPEAEALRRAPSCLKEGYAVLKAVDFSARVGWSQAEIDRLNAAYGLIRWIGAVTLEDGRQAGLVGQPMRGGHYWLLLDGQACLGDTAIIEHFLHLRRSGHRGGKGRAQGRPAKDGCAYTRPACMRLSAREIEALVRLGGGDLSAGARRLAREPLPPESGEERRARRGATHLVKVYLDEASRVALREGAQNATEGLRRRLAPHLGSA